MNNNNNKNGENKVNDEIVRCPLCNTPIARRKGNSLYHLQRKGKDVYETETEIIPSSNVSQFRIKCPKKDCPGAALFITISETMSLNDSIKTKKG